MDKINKLDKNTRYYIPSPELTANYAKMELDPNKDI